MMIDTTADRLQRARADRFVGRKKETDLVVAMLQGDVPYRFLYFSGPGGVGKTELLHACSRLCLEHDTTPCHLYLPEITCSRRALKKALGAVTSERTSGGRKLLLMDGFEHVSTFEEWIREELFGQIPDDMRVCFAGRLRLSQKWSLDPGWQPILSIIQLSNFDVEETATYLRQAGVPDALHDSIGQFTRGHPLTLSMMTHLSERNTLEPLSPADCVEMIPDRMADLLESVPSPAHRDALELAAVAMRVTEDLILDIDSTNSGFARYQWLRQLPFVDVDKRGLVMQETSREVILKYLQHFNITRFRWLTKRLERYFLKRLEDTVKRDVRHWLIQLGFLISHFHPVHLAQKRELSLQLLSDGQSSQAGTDRAVWTDIEAMLLAHEGPQSLESFRYWRRNEARVGVVKGDGGRVEGFITYLPPRRISEADSSGDPGVAGIRAYLRRVKAFRDDRPVVLIRHWMALDTYQKVSPVRSLLNVAAVESLFQGPKPWGLLFCMQDERDWILDVAGDIFHRFKEGDFVLDGKSYFWAGSEFDETPVTGWLARMVETVIGAAGEPRADGLSPARAEFERSVRAALHNLDRPERLRDNALLYSRIVSARVDTLDTRLVRAKLLVQIIQEETETFLRFQGDEKYFQIIDKTHLVPLGKHDIVAAELGYTLGTYRRHLGKAQTRLVEALWEREQNLLH